MSGPSVRREERKFVTVVFADLVGFTSRAESMDPEDVRTILSSYHERVRHELERFGGTVEKFIGDAVMAVFGAPQTHEDDPERAVRAALAIREWVRDEEADLQLRIGLNTGEVLVALDARPSEGEAMVAGDLVNSAQRIQNAAPVNGILVGERTYRATRDAIEFRNVEAIVAKGKSEPIAVWEAIAPLARVVVERMEGAPLIGRERELSLVQSTLERVKSAREPQLVTLVGVPGIGKSRLVFELFKSIEVGGELVYWRRGRSLPYGEGVVFWALAEMVKLQAGILESDPVATAEEKLRAAVSDLLHDSGDARWVEMQLRPLLGLGADGETSGVRREEAFAAWRRFFEAMAERRPLVLIFEDLHWADDALLDFVDEMVDWASGVPMLVLVTARPELLARRPGWGGGKPNAVTISLSPLSEEETSRLVHALMHRSALPAETQSALLDRAGGNPLYAEEFVALAQEQASRGTAGSVLPESVQGIVAARLDGLSREQKALLQDAAVIGRVFWASALAHVGNTQSREIETHLHALERREFVRRERRTSVAGETEYVFRHVLVRDVAYGEIPRAQRGEKHRLTAEWIESLGRPEDHAEVLAHHYLAALEYARATGKDVHSISEPARIAIRHAGDRALSLNAFDAAARFYASALELTPMHAAERPQLLLGYGEAQSQLAAGNAEATLSEAVDAFIAASDREGAARAEIFIADLIWMRGTRDLAYQHLTRAVELLDHSSPSPTKARVLSEVSRYHMLASRHDEAIRIGEEALAMAEQFGLDEVRAHALNNIGAARAYIGDDRGLRQLARSIEIATAAHSMEAFRGYNNLGVMHVVNGDTRKAMDVWSPAWELASRYRGVQNAQFLRSQRFIAAYGMGHWEEFLRLGEEFVVEAGPTHYQSTTFLEFRGRVRLARGDLIGALEDSELALSQSREIKDPQRIQPAVAFAAFALLSAGRIGECEVLVEELLALDPVGVPVPAWVAPVLELAWLLTWLGRGDEFLEAATKARHSSKWLDAGTAFARGEVELAADICADIGVVPNEAYTRLRAAEKLLEQGRRADADAQLEQCLEFYRSVGASFYIREAETLMARSA
jgi:class 3 adenylate cyclase/tetratricopeptide (TPR) repeat protein